MKAIDPKRNRQGKKLRAVAFVPIKLNSQRLKNKNILPLGSHPLCWHIFDSLLKVKDLDEVYVYCSDEAVKSHVPEGVTFLKRDARLDGDLIKGFEIYESFINDVDADVYVLAHATAPFIRSESIQTALDAVLYGGRDSAFSAQEIRTFAWFKDAPLNYDINDVPRTQDIEPVYIETSAFFMFRREIFTQHRRRIGFNPHMQVVGQIEAIDIDTGEDYEIALRFADQNERCK